MNLQLAINIPDLKKVEKIILLFFLNKFGFKTSEIIFNISEGISWDMFLDLGINQEVNLISS